MSVTEILAIAGFLVSGTVFTVIVLLALAKATQ